MSVRRFLNVTLNQAALDGSERAAIRLDSLQQCRRALLDPIGQRLDRVGASQRINGVDDTGFRRDHLLRAQRNLR